MTDYYFDTSAIVKLYVPEKGSQWVSTLCNQLSAQGRPSHRIAFAKISLVEVAAAVTRLERMGALSPAMHRAIYRRFLQDTYERFRLLNITDDVLYLAADAAQNLFLRGCDAVHLAAAQTLKKQMEAFHTSSLVFVSADRQLCQASRAVGLSTENPEDYA